VPTTDVEPVGAPLNAPAQVSAVPRPDDPVPKLNPTCNPILLVVSQVPVVGPAIVIVLYSQVFADVIVNRQRDTNIRRTDFNVRQYTPVRVTANPK
jgi:hypothetical protein